MTHTEAIEFLASKYGNDPGVEEALKSLAEPSTPASEPGLKRYGLNPDNGLMYESARGAWVRYEDAARHATSSSGEDNK